MGMPFVEGTVSGGSDHRVPVCFLVDSGATYTLLPSDVWQVKVPSSCDLQPRPAPSTWRACTRRAHGHLHLGAENRQQHGHTRSFLHHGFRTLPLTENVGHRAAVYIETCSLSHGLRAGDAIVAATTAESNLTLCTSNAKHFRPIEGLSLRVFRP